MKLLHVQQKKTRFPTGGEAKRESFELEGALHGSVLA